MTRLVTSIGKYRVLAYLGAGGMAEVFKCQLKGIGGFDKTVVIKRIRPDVADDAEFIQMFLDEARLAAMLSHPNIVQVFEVDQVVGQPYIAMEFADGPSLLQIIREARRRDMIHFGHMARIVSGIALGLDYAHQVTGPDGRPLGLVHRDVTPHNIVVTRNGIPKLFDFGIAKAEGRMSQTRIGGFKGKLAYISPEQLHRRDATALSDVYSLGVTLYQATVGHLPFAADSEGALLKLVADGTFTKPSERVKGYPASLERVVLWAMCADASMRCPGARMLHNALEQLMTSDELKSTNDDFVAWLLDLFPTTESYLEAKAPPYVTGTISSGRQHAITVASTPSGRLYVPDTSGTQPNKRHPRTVLVALGAGIAVILTLLALVLWWKPSPPPATQQSAVVARPVDESAALASFLDEAEKSVQAGKYAQAADLVERADKLEKVDAKLQIQLTRLKDTIETGVLLASARRALKQGDRAQATELAKQVLDRDAQNAVALALLDDVRAGSADATVKRPEPAKSSARAPSPGKLVITSEPVARVYVDDRPHGKTPSTIDSLEPGSHEIEVRADGFQPQTKTVKVRSRATDIVAFQLAKAERHRSPTPTASAPAVNAPVVKSNANATPSAAKPTEETKTAAPATAVNEERPRRAPEAASGPGGVLPRQHTVRSARELARIFRAVEDECVAAGGSKDAIKNVTMDLAKDLFTRMQNESTAVVYPRAMFTFIMQSSSAGRSRGAIADALRRAHLEGALAGRAND